MDSHIHAEQALLGCLMIDATSWDRVADIVGAEDFARAEHRDLFRAIAEVAEDGSVCDPVSVLERMARRGVSLDGAARTYVLTLASETPTGANVARWARVVRDASIRRELVGVCIEIQDRASAERGDAAEIINDAAAQIGAIVERGQRGSLPQDMRAVVKDVVWHLTEMAERGGDLLGLSTGFADLDAQTAGLQPGDLVIVAGRPSMGKTTFAMNIADSVALEGKRVLVFSLEMPARQIGMRAIASNARVPFQRVRSADMDDGEWSRVTNASGRLAACDMIVDDSSVLTSLDIVTRARREHRKAPLDLIVIDYLQLISSGDRSENRTLEVARQTRDLKLLAKQLNAPVIVLSQLNRGLANRSDKRPVMSDLRESGAIEQDADVIVFLYRDEVYHEDSHDKGTAEIIIAKQRNGPIGTVRLAFFGKYVKFESLDPSWQPEERESNHRSDKRSYEYE